MSALKLLYFVVSILLSLQFANSEDLTVDEARCIIDGKTIAWVGDSIARFCYFGMNYWLEEGELPSDEYSSKWGDNDQDYDRQQPTTWYVKNIIIYYP